VTQEERHVFEALLRHVTDELDAANITYWLTDGTLIGAYRHHGIVPWDDDLDIRLRRSDRPQLEELYKSRLSVTYGIFYHGSRYLKLYARNGTNSTECEWVFPYIDVWFTYENATHVWNREDYEVIHPRSTIYPLRRRPFGSLSLWTPHDTVEYLRQKNATEYCKSNMWWHKFERYTIPTVQTVACRELWPYFPFVFRNERRDDGKIIEVLKVGDRVLSTLEFDAA